MGSLRDNFETISVSIDERIATVALNRPEIHNAFNEVLIAELTEVFNVLGNDDNVRVVVLTGRGKSFCAGADLEWMGRMRNYSFEENYDDSYALAECMYTIYSCPKPVIGCINGSAFGGGCGLVAACDISLASNEARFALSEVKLGLVPACIAPYVIMRIGIKNARELFLTGERINAKMAQNIGLINYALETDLLQHRIRQLCNTLITSGPNALAICKQLIADVPTMSLKEAKQYTARMIAKLRVSDEAKEGISAFFEKRKPSWAHE